MLSERIYHLRRKNGFSQEQLAEQIGVSRQAISKWESGTSTPELEKLIALAECFHVTLDELVKESEDQGLQEYQPISERPEEQEQKNADNRLNLELKTGIGLCLIGAFCLILFGIMMMVNPGAAQQLNTASAITLNGSGIVLILCVLSMVIGLVLILRKK